MNFISLRRIGIRFVAMLAACLTAFAIAAPGARAETGYTAQEIVDSGNRFFGSTSGRFTTTGSRNSFAGQSSKMVVSRSDVHFCRRLLA